MKNHKEVSIAALKHPVSLIPDVVNHLAHAKELYTSDGYATAKVYAESFNVWPRFAAWLEQQEAAKMPKVKKKLSKVQSSDRRQVELRLSDQSEK